MSPSNTTKIFLFLCAMPLLFRVTTVASSHDPTVCTAASVPLTLPLPYLGEKFSAQILWTSHTDRKFYFVHENYDKLKHRSSVRISMPLLAVDSMLLYDLQFDSISIFDDVTSQNCQVHTADATYYSYGDLPWLASLPAIIKHAQAAKDLTGLGQTQMDGITVNQFSSCIFDFGTNTTSLYNFYFAGGMSSFNNSWLYPRVPNTARLLPYAITLKAKRVLNGKVTNFDVTGKVASFDVNPTFQDSTFLPPPGAWCPVPAHISLPQFPSSFSLLAEIVDMDFKKITYEQVWFDAKRKFVRKDWKPTLEGDVSTDTDPITSVFDFNIGVLYKMDRNFLSCQRSDAIALGDDFTVPAKGTQNQPFSKRFEMASSDVYFYSKAQGIQFIGKQTVRSVNSDVYMGYYFDRDAGRNFTIQWYFTSSKWTLSTGTVLETGALIRMDVWRGASINPKVYNILQYTTGAPDYDVFDRSLCYNSQQKMRLAILFTVSDPTTMNTVTNRLLRDRIESILSEIINEKYRFSGIQVEFDGAANLFVHATLIDRSPIFNTNTNHGPQLPMEGAYKSLEGAVLSQKMFLLQNGAGGVVTLIPKEIVRENFTQEFATPPTTTRPSTTAPVAPPLLGRTTTTKTMVPPQQSSSSSSSTTRLTTAAPAAEPSGNGPACNCANCVTSPPCTCPQLPGDDIPAWYTPSWRQCQPLCTEHKMCPCSWVNQNRPCTSTDTGRPKNYTPTRQECQSYLRNDNSNNKNNNQNNDSEVTIAALVGAMFGTLALGLMLGFVVARIYHFVRVQPQPKLINKLDDETSY